MAGSIWAITWPALTFELKSTLMSSIVPEIWLPTSMLRTGVSDPLAVTAWTTSPRETVVDLNSMARFLGWFQ